MRNYLLLGLFIAFTANVSSQDLMVSYGVSTKSLLDKNQKEKLSDDVKKIFTEAQENFKYITFKLKVKDGESLFLREEELRNDGVKKFKIAAAMAGFNGVFYSNSSEEEKIHQWDGYGQKFLITSKFDNLQWNITKESKLLLDLQAYKAIAVQRYFDGEEYKKWEIVAWFTPEINKPFGPGGYGSLPGLILELQKGSKIYSAKNIETVKLNAEDVRKPKEGKLITREEFDEIGQKMTKKIKDF